MALFDHGIRGAVGILALLFVLPVAAQENLDQGKTPAQLFASDCAICHKTPRGLGKNAGLFGLDSFLRQHYTASRETAAALSKYLEAFADAPPPPVKRVRRSKKRSTKSADKKPAEVKSKDMKKDAKAEDAKAKDAKSMEGKSKDSKTMEAKPAEAKKTEAKAEPKAETKPAAKPESKPEAKSETKPAAADKPAKSD